MNSNELTKKLGEMKKAWLVQWRCYAQNEDECLKKMGIEKKVVDIISVRKSFEEIVETAKEIYLRKILSFSEKIYFSNYKKGRKRINKLFEESVSIFRYYQSDFCQNLIKTLNKKDLSNSEKKDLIDKWKKYPKYITVGHNPSLEICRVFNLVVYQNRNGNEIIEWDHPLADGDFKKERYEFKK